MVWRCIIFCLVFYSCADTFDNSTSTDEEVSLWSVDENFIKEGAPFDLIQNPSFKNISEMKDLKDEDRLLLIKIDNEIRAYPYYYLNYSEVLNDYIGSVNYVVSYCPQTKSGICFYGGINGQQIPMIASGYLFKDNLVLSDLERQNFWSQMLITGIRGEEIYKQISKIYSFETKFETVKKYFPNAKVYHRNFSTEKSNQFKSNRKKTNWAGYLGVVVNGIKKNTYVFNHNKFTELTMYKVTDKKNTIVVVGDNNKKFFTSFYVSHEVNLKIVKDKFPVILEDDKGNEWNTFGEEVSGNGGQKLKSPIFYNADLWAWEYFFENVEESK
ncbi:hypothetical protein TSEDIMI_80089 [Tenacibaculum sediminilitoris]|uniref:DUF3179 domain-containing (seleno)protein n=1 Tax=Tenacibaculum sediminilitoris TaxID=1820334 RepID=UPI003895CD85